MGPYVGLSSDTQREAEGQLGCRLLSSEEDEHEQYWGGGGGDGLLTEVAMAA